MVLVRNFLRPSYRAANRTVGAIRETSSEGALGAFAGTLALGLEDGWADDDEVDPAERWRAAVLAYVAGVVASVTFVVMVALLDRLD